MPHVRRTGVVEGLMELSQVLKEINCLKNCLIHLGQGQVLTLPEEMSCVPLPFFVYLPVPCRYHLIQEAACDSASTQVEEEKRGEHGEDQLYLRPRTLREADSAA